MVNVPLSAGAGSREFREAVEQQWLPALEGFRPQMLFISAGFDAHRDDGMAFLRLLEPDYAWVTSLVRQVAAKYAGGRIVSLLEGGYDLDVLGRCVAAHLGEPLPWGTARKATSPLRSLAPANIAVRRSAAVAPPCSRARKPPSRPAREPS